MEAKQSAEVEWERSGMCSGNRFVVVAQREARRMEQLLEKRRVHVREAIAREKNVSNEAWIDAEETAGCAAATIKCVSLAENEEQALDDCRRRSTRSGTESV